MITGMNHTGFVVKDVEASAEFYMNVIGLKEVARRERDGGPISDVVGYENTHLKAVLLGLDENGSHILELVQYIRPEASDRPTEERAVLGASHLCFDVDDINATFDAMIASGAKKLNRPVEVSPGRVVCYLQDPDGNWIELIQSAE